MIEGGLATRRIDIFVFGRTRKPLCRARISFALDDQPAGEVTNSQGRGSIELPVGRYKVAVTVAVGDEVQKRLLAHETDALTFHFDQTDDDGADDGPLGALTRKATILFLAANPTTTNRLGLDGDAAAIQDELDRGERDRLELVTRWAVTPLGLLRELRRLKPMMLHFSGHGTRDGLVFVGADGLPQVVSSEAIARTCRAAGRSIRVVVLSACYAEQQADALIAQLDCVIGMSGSVSDSAARTFAVGFYGGIANGESVAASFEQGRAALALVGLDDGDPPRLRVRDGVDANGCFIRPHTRPA